MSEGLDLVGKVRLDTTDLDGASNKIGGVFKTLAGLAAAAFAGVQVKQFFKDAVTGASSLNESTSKIGVVFGSAAQSVVAFANNSATAFGQSKVQALEAVGVFGNLLRSVGLAEDKSAEMSTTMTGLASDLASFNNTDVSTALDALRGGLVGETEPLKKFGVNLNEATIKAKAMELGLYSGKGALDSSAKAQASYALIMEQTKLAQGDFARTSAGLANQQKILTATWQDAKTKLGAGLLPVITKVVAALAVHLPSVIDGVILTGKELAALFSGKSDAQGFGEVMDNIAGNSGKWVAAFRALGQIFVDARVAFKAFTAGFSDNAAVGESVGGLATTFAVLGVATREFLQAGLAVVLFLADHADATKVAIGVVLAFVVALKTLQGLEVLAGQINRFIQFREEAGKATKEIGKLGDTLKSVGSKVVNIAQRGADDAALRVMYLKDKIDELKDKSVNVTSKTSTGDGGGGDSKGAGEKSAQGFASGFAGAIGGAIGGLASAAVVAIAGVVGAPVWAVLAVGAGIVLAGGLIFSFRDEIGRFFTEGLPRFFTDTLPDFGSLLLGKGRELLNGLENGAREKWAELQQWWTDLPYNTGLAIGEVVGTLYQKGSDLITGAWDGAKAIWESVTTWFSETSTRVLEAIGETALTLYEKGSVLLQGLWNGINAIWDANFKFWTELPGKTQTLIGDVVGTLYQKGSELLSGLWNGIRNKWENDGPVKFFLTLPAAVVGLIGFVLTTLAGKGADLISGMYNGITGFWTGTVSPWLGGIRERVTGSISGARDWLFNAGMDIMRGLLGGIDAMWETVKRKFSELGAGIIDGFAKSIDSNSPSKKFIHEAENIGDGIIVGIDNKRRSVVAAISSLGKDMLGRIAVPDVNIGGTLEANRALAIAGAGASPPTSATAVTVEINVNGSASADSFTPSVLAQISNAIRAGVGTK